MTTRHVTGQITRASGDGRTIEMRALAYNVLDSYQTVFVPPFGAAALRSRLPRLSWGHDWADPVGVATAFRVEADGIYITGRLSDPDAVPRARQAAAQLADGTIDQVSIGFSRAESRSPTESERQRWPGVERMILDGEIDEIALVLRAAVPGAEVLSVRGRSGSTTDRDRLLDQLVDDAVELGARCQAGVNDHKRRELMERITAGLDRLDRMGPRRSAHPQVQVQGGARSQVDAALARLRLR